MLRDDAKGLSGVNACIYKGKNLAPRRSLRRRVPCCRGALLPLGRADVVARGVSVAVECLRRSNVSGWRRGAWLFRPAPATRGFIGVNACIYRDKPAATPTSKGMGVAHEAKRYGIRGADDLQSGQKSAAVSQALRDGGVPIPPFAIVGPCLPWQPSRHEKQTALASALCCRGSSVMVCVQSMPVHLRTV